MVSMMENFCDWLAATPLSLAFQNWTWFVPSVQTVHILCVAVVLTSAYVIGLRLGVTIHAHHQMGFAKAAMY